MYLFVSLIELNNIVPSSLFKQKIYIFLVNKFDSLGLYLVRAYQCPTGPRPVHDFIIDVCNFATKLGEILGWRLRYILIGH